MDGPRGNTLQEQAIATLWDIAGGSVEIFRELVDEYATMAKEVVAALDRALAANDARAAEQAAHSLKGSSSMMGAHLVQKACEGIERAAADGDVGAARALLPALVRVHEETLQQLLAARDGPRPGA